MKWLCLLAAMLFSAVSVAQERQPVMVQLSENPSTGERWVNLLKLTPAEYKEFGTSIIGSYEKDRKKFAETSKNLLIALYGMSPDHPMTEIFDIDPLFNRSLLFASVAAENKIKLEDKDLISFQQDCLVYSAKAKTEQQRLFIAALASEVDKHNKKLE